MKINTRRGIALSTLGAMTIATMGGLAVPAEAKKSSKWKNLAIAGGVVTGYGLLKKNKTAAIVGGVGTAYAYSRYRKESKREKKNAESARIRWYKQRYGNNWRSHYRRGT